MTTLECVGGQSDGEKIRHDGNFTSTVIKGETYVPIEFKVGERLVKILMLANTKPEDALAKWKERHRDE